MNAIDNPIFFKDFYKVSHYEQYPKGTELIFSNFTPRKSMIPGVNHIVFFGLKYLVKKYLSRMFFDFFSDNDYEVHAQYKVFMNHTLGTEKQFNHICSLKKLGYLPIEIRALPEGCIVPIGVPVLTIHNTLPEFYWLPNMLETILSCILWGACNSATLAHEYRKVLDGYASKTSDNEDFVNYQGHDFSFRGMFGLEAAMLSGAGHLLSFKGTDTIPAILFLNEYYQTPLSCGSSVPATEHSVMSASGCDNELDTFKRLITEIYPDGIVSIVSDTWDLWNVIASILPSLKDQIMARNGKVVIRPDSGDPANIICGTGDCFSHHTQIVKKGLIECLWDIFGGTINSKGFKELDPHIGAIYGDSITLDRCKEICRGLEQKGFASTNIVFGIGSFTYQYNTRDTFGWAMKATYAEINGKPHEIFKRPKTDDGTKNSLKGLIVVRDKLPGLCVIDRVSWDDFNSEVNELKLYWKDGKGYGDYHSSFEEIKSRSRI